MWERMMSSINSHYLWRLKRRSRYKFHRLLDHERELAQDLLIMKKYLLLGFWVSISIILPTNLIHAAETVGNLENIDSNGIASGWAYDPDASSQSITVHFYVDGPPGTGTLVTFISANILRSDVNATYNIHGSHGFSGSIPTQYKDGKQHTLYVYPIDTASPPNIQTSGSPMTFTLSQVPIGFFDLIDSNGYAIGWALDPDVPSQSIDVHFYVDGQAPANFAGIIKADSLRADVNSTTGYAGDHGFSFSMPVTYRDGQSHTIYAYGIDTAGGINFLLTGSPKSFTQISPSQPINQTILNWFAPNCFQSSTVNSAADCGGIFDRPADWSNLSAKTDVYQFFIDYVSENKNGIIGKAVPYLKSKNVAIAVEGGGTLNFAGCNSLNGENSAAIELAKIKPIYDAGGAVAYISLDAPEARIMQGGLAGNCGFTLQQATQELVDYLKTVHKTYPQIKFGLITNFPNWSYGTTPSYWGANQTWGDYRIVLDYEISQIRAQGEQVYFVHADNPYDYALGVHSSPWTGINTIDWMGRIVDLEKQVRALGLRFGLIFNSETGAATSDQKFYQDTSNFISTYKLRGYPDDIIIESWYARPSIILKETDLYSFSSLANNILGPRSTPPPPPPPLAGDLNGDKTINSIDFSIMNGRWLTSDTTSDLNKDGTVNSLDFSMMNGNWLKTY